MDLTVTASTDKTITLVWGVVQGPIDHYKVTCTSSTGVTTEVKPWCWDYVEKRAISINWVHSEPHNIHFLFQLTVAKDITTITLAELDPGTEYTIMVAARRGRQQSNVATIDAFTGAENSQVPFIGRGFLWSCLIVSRIITNPPPQHLCLSLCNKLMQSHFWCLLSSAPCI